ncbi:MAG: PadR family transcriptional regulator [Methylocystaceae bacterium]
MYERMGCGMVDYADASYWQSLIKMSLSRYFVFHALAQGPKHGYEISKWVTEVTNGCCSPSEGALYPMMKEIEQGEYVECHTEMVSGRSRKIYTLTDKGRLAYDLARVSWTDAARLILEPNESVSTCCSPKIK